MTKTIPHPVLDVLKQCRCDGSQLFLPNQLDRKLYADTNKFLELLGGKWNRSAKAHLFESDCAERMDEAVMTGEVTDFKKLYQFFETPDGLADQMVQAAQMTRLHSVLEPSAGRGAIVRAVQREFPGKSVCCCELDPQNWLYLDQLPFTLLYRGRGSNAPASADFLQLEPEPRFDRIVANPPFRQGQDVDHVRRMFEWLLPAGRLVAITSPSWQYRANGKYAAFRNWLKDLDHDVSEVPAGTFRQSGTDIRTLFLTINK